MATAFTTTITSDVSQKEGASTRTFALDGINYEIDLTYDEGQELAASLAPFIAAGRKLSTRRTARR